MLCLALLAAGCGSSKPKPEPTATAQPTPALPQPVILASLDVQPANEDFIGGIRQIAAIKGYSGTITHLAFSADGARLAFADQDGTIIVWEMATLTPVSVIRAAAVDSLAFSPDGTRLAGVSAGKVTLWDASSGQVIASAEAGAGALVTFSPDASVLLVVRQDAASGTAQAVVAWWDPATLKETASSPTGVASPQALAFNQDGSRFAVGGHSESVEVWDAKARTVLISLPADVNSASGGAITSLGFSSDGHYLTGAGYAINVWSPVVFRWSLDSGRALYRSNLSSDDSVLTSADGSLLTSIMTGNFAVAAGTEPPLTAGFYSISGDTEPSYRVGLGSESYFQAAFSPNGKYGAGATQSGTVEIWGVPADYLAPGIRLTGGDAYLRKQLDDVLNLVKLHTGEHAVFEIRVTTQYTIVETCGYSAPGSPTTGAVGYRTRPDYTVSLVDLKQQTSVNQKMFEGSDPPACPTMIESGSGSPSEIGSPPDDAALAWIRQQVPGLVKSSQN